MFTQFLKIESDTQLLNITTMVALLMKRGYLNNSSLIC